MFFKAICALGQALSFHECSEELWSQISFITAEVKNQCNSKVKEKVSLGLYWEPMRKELSEETYLRDTADDNHASNFGGLVNKDLENAL